MNSPFKTTKQEVKYVTLYEVGSIYFLNRAHASIVAKELKTTKKQVKNCQRFSDDGSCYIMGELLEPVYSSVSEWRKSTNSPFKTPTYSGQRNLELKDGKTTSDAIKFLEHSGWTTTKESKNSDCVVLIRRIMQKNLDYNRNQLKKLIPIDHKASIKIRSSSGETNWLTLDADCFTAILLFYRANRKKLNGNQR